MNRFYAFGLTAILVAATTTSAIAATTIMSPVKDGLWSDPTTWQNSDVPNVPTDYPYWAGNTCPYKVTYDASAGDLTVFAVAAWGAALPQQRSSILPPMPER